MVDFLILYLLTYYTAFYTLCHGCINNYKFAFSISRLYVRKHNKKNSYQNFYQWVIYNGIPFVVHIYAFMSQGEENESKNYKARAFTLCFYIRTRIDSKKNLFYLWLPRMSHGYSTHIALANILQIIRLLAAIVNYLYRAIFHIDG